MPNRSPAFPLRILVADDEPAVAETLAACLIADGHSVTLVHDGLEALALFQRDHFDLIMTDRIMPGMCGEELAAAVKAFAPNVPIIMVSGSLDPVPGGALKIPNIDTIIPKPFSVEALTFAIATHFPSS